MVHSFSNAHLSENRNPPPPLKKKHHSGIYTYPLETRINIAVKSYKYKVVKTNKNK